MRGDFAIDHVALALANGPHIGGDVAGYEAEARALAREMRDPCAPNFVFAGEACDIGAGAADPLTLAPGRAPARLRHVPGQQIAALSAAEDQDVKSFRLRHGVHHHVRLRSATTVSADKRQQSRQMRSFVSMVWSSRDLVPRFSSIQDGTSFARGCR